MEIGKIGLNSGPTMQVIQQRTNLATVPNASDSQGHLEIEID